MKPGDKGFYRFVKSNGELCFREAQVVDVAPAGIPAVKIRWLKFPNRGQQGFERKWIKASDFVQEQVRQEQLKAKKYIYPPRHD